MVIDDHDGLLVTWLMWRQSVPKLLEKVGAVLLISRLGCMKVHESRNTGPKGTY